MVHIYWFNDCDAICDQNNFKFPTHKNCSRVTTFILKFNFARARQTNSVTYKVTLVIVICTLQLIAQTKSNTAIFFTENQCPSAHNRSVKILNNKRSMSLKLKYLLRHQLGRLFTCIKWRQVLSCLVRVTSLLRLKQRHYTTQKLNVYIRLW